MFFVCHLHFDRVKRSSSGWMAVTSITHHYYMITNKFENLHAPQRKINRDAMINKKLEWPLVLTRGRWKSSLNACSIVNWVFLTLKVVLQRSFSTHSFHILEESLNACCIFDVKWFFSSCIMQANATYKLIWFFARSLCE